MASSAAGVARASAAAEEAWVCVEEATEACEVGSVGSTLSLSLSLVVAAAVLCVCGCFGCVWCAGLVCA